MTNFVTGWSFCSDSWVGLTEIYDVPLSCPPAQPLQPKAHLPRQNSPDRGIAKIKVNSSLQADGTPRSIFIYDDLPC